MNDWYFGKLVGFQRRKFEPNSPSSHSEHQEEQDLERESTILRELEDDDKDERFFVRFVRHIRNKFIARGLIGEIRVLRVFGFVSSSMKCKIDESYYLQFSQSTYGVGEEFSAEESANLNYSYRRAITVTDAILNSLEARAMSWEETDFDGQVILTRGSNFSFQDRLIGLFGYSLVVEISATVQSLINSRHSAHFLAPKKFSFFSHSEKAGKT
jgi:hypothetical protein